MAKPKKLRVLALMHEDLVPPDTLTDETPEEIAAWQMEYDVCRTLNRLGHEVTKLGVRDEVLPIREAIESGRPHIAVNLLEEFHGRTAYDHHVVSYLELMRQHYTGCSPRGLILARDKALSKEILSFHRIRVPAFSVFRIGRKVRRPKWLHFPLFVKSLIEEASLGISRASLVETDQKLEERVRFIHESIGTDAIVERFIPGKELYVGVLGNRRLQVLPTWELFFENLPPDVPRIATAKVKWDSSYQDKIGVMTGPAELTEDQEGALARLSRRTYRVLGLRGYARLDFRMDEQGRFYLLEANPNPQLAANEDFARSAEAAGFSYEALIQRILGMGLRATL